MSAKDRLLRGMIVNVRRKPTGIVFWTSEDGRRVGVATGSRREDRYFVNADEVSFWGWAQARECYKLHIDFKEVCNHQRGQYE